MDDVNDESNNQYFVNLKNVSYYQQPQIPDSGM